MKSSKSNQGFSLVELMIGVVIIGILGVVAFPSYQEFIRTGNRADAMGQLVELTIEMEQFRASNNTYAGAAQGGGDTGTPDSDLLMELDEYVTNNYTVTILAADRDSFMLRAVPVGMQEDDVCGTITIGLNGDFNYAPLDGSVAPDSCEK
ncbi:type IV pilin protein [Litoribrevibacter euphylliae]|uniref:Type IV pilin protein n=1 Tax=Litoribrevibacter euphylliae TaxID=1834034 RepID=A0ABV7HHH3_9GAMM